jgi:hypothetical protein
MKKIGQVKRPAKVTILADGRVGPFIRFVQQAYRELNLRPLTAESAQTLLKRAQRKSRLIKSNNISTTVAYLL